MDGSDIEEPEQPLAAAAAAGSAHEHECQVAVLGAGILKSTTFERHTDRYGAVFLTVIDSIPGAPAPARTVPVPGSDLAARILQDLAKFDADFGPAAEAAAADRRTDRVVAFDDAPLGAAGTLVAHVIALTSDYDWGDSVPELRLPKVGERVVLGSGTLFTEEYMDIPVIGVRPADGRGDNWMDRYAISRCRDHLVRLELEIRPDNAPAGGAAREQAARQKGGLTQPAAQTAPTDFPVADPLSQLGRAASIRPRSAVARSGSQPRSRTSPRL